MRHPPSGRHPYLTVRLRGSLTLRYRRCDLESRQQTISHKEELNLNFVPSIRTTNTRYGRFFFVVFVFSDFYLVFVFFDFYLFFCFSDFYIFLVVRLCTLVCGTLSVRALTCNEPIANTGMDFRNRSPENALNSR